MVRIIVALLNWLWLCYFLLFYLLPILHVHHNETSSLEFLNKREERSQRMIQIQVESLLYAHYKKTRPKMTWMVMMLAFLSALFGGSMPQNLFAESLVLTSATFTTAMLNLIPGITFVVAIFFRLEKLGWKTRAGQAKVLGTLIGIGGAMLLTFYKGFEIKIWSIKVDFKGHVAASQQHQKSHAHILGPILASCSCFSSAFSLILQAKMSELYPCHYSSTALISIMGALQAGLFALSTERDWSQWKLGWNLRLLVVVYAGVVASGFTIIFLMFCVRMRGPLFVSIFSPLMLVCVAIGGSLFFNEKLHMGSVVGGAIIICGLYMVLWGKKQEVTRTSKLAPSTNYEESDQEDPIVPSNVIGIAPNFHPMNDMEQLSIQQVLKDDKESTNLDSKV